MKKLLLIALTLLTLSVSGQEGFYEFNYNTVIAGENLNSKEGVLKEVVEVKALFYEDNLTLEDDKGSVTFKVVGFRKTEKELIFNLEIKELRFICFLREEGLLIIREDESYLFLYNYEPKLRYE